MSGQSTKSSTFSRFVYKSSAISILWLKTCRFLQVSLFVYSFIFIYTALGTLRITYPMKNVITEYGCHLVDLISLYGIFLNQSTSLAIALFRYICVVQQGFLINRKLTLDVRIFCSIIKQSTKLNVFTGSC